MYIVYMKFLHDQCMLYVPNTNKLMTYDYPMTYDLLMMVIVSVVNAGKRQCAKFVKLLPTALGVGKARDHSQASLCTPETTEVCEE